MGLAEPPRRRRGDRVKADGDVHVVPKTSSSSAITSPMWMPIRNCIHPVGGDVVVPFCISNCIVMARLDRATMLGNSSRKPSRCSSQAAAMIEDDRVYRGSMGLDVACYLPRPRPSFANSCDVQRRQSR